MRTKSDSKMNASSKGRTEHEKSAPSTRKSTASESKAASKSTSHTSGRKNNTK